MSKRESRVSPRLAALTATAAAMCLAAGCTATLNTEELQNAIKTGLQQKVNLPITGVTCPDERPMKAGDAFECKAQVETGGQLVVQVTQSDDRGNINWELVNGDSVMSLDSLEQQIKSGLAQQAGVEAVVECGDGLRMSIPGQTLECTAKVPSGKVPIAVTVKDDKGNVSWETKAQQ